MAQEVKSQNPDEVTDAEIANMVKEKIAAMADKIIREEVEKEIEEKISGKKISASRRMKIFQKVSEDVKKQVRAKDSELYYNIITVSPPCLLIYLYNTKFNRVGFWTGP